MGSRNTNFYLIKIYKAQWSMSRNSRNYHRQEKTERYSFELRQKIVVIGDLRQQLKTKAT